jgi:hypothetical protein
MMSRRLILVAALGALWITSGPAAADAAPWPGRPGRYVFEVTRDGKPIGTQVVTVSQDGGATTAITESTIAVKMLGIVVYRYHQVITETFQERRMVALHAETKDPDGLRVIDLARDARDHWSGAIDKKPQSFDCDCMSSTMWQVGSLQGRRMIEASQGKPQSIAVEDRGAETLDLPAGPVQVHHFAVTGGITREVWFDEAGNLVAAQQVGRDGSLIRQNLIEDPAGKRQASAETAQP